MRYGGEFMTYQIGAISVFTGTISAG